LGEGCHFFEVVFLFGEEPFEMWDGFSPFDLFPYLAGDEDFPYQLFVVVGLHDDNGQFLRFVVGFAFVLFGVQGAFVDGFRGGVLGEAGSMSW
jgi:hypothetical protein